MSVNGGVGHSLGLYIVHEKDAKVSKINKEINSNNNINNTFLCPALYIIVYSHVPACTQLNK